ncbi:hypothetical protein [Streptomyces sp. TR02-1]|uniref:hypothetical protein n=1 Tax=Streptomyces sp. TR02-1 TaxID=3385977 RepID=UPI0039A37E56
MNRRRSRLFPLLARAAASMALAAIRHWQKRNPNVADYRATESLDGLRTATTHLGHLHRGTHTDYWHHAHARFVATFGLPDKDGVPS